MEVYGEKPKRFTKEWWEYFWDYYKWHTIGGIVVLILVVSTIVECANRKNYDLQIDYISEKGLSLQAQDGLVALMEKNIDDATQNGKTEAFLTYLDMNKNNDPQYVQAMTTKYAVEVGNTDAFVFLVSKDYADQLLEGEMLLETKEWCDAEPYMDYFVNLSDSKALKDIGVNTEDLYVCVLKLGDGNSEEKLLKQKNGINFAKFLIGER